MNLDVVLPALCRVSGTERLQDTAFKQDGANLTADQPA